MRFTKMHGLGNDYVYVDGFSQAVDAPAELAVRIADRHRGVGGDGLILILPSRVADVRMRVFNADGSEAQMCGNGIRCLAKYAYDHGLSRANPMRVETASGIKAIQLQLDAAGHVAQATVDMGAPILRPRDIPMAADGEQAVDVPISAAGRAWRMTGVSMGNPHAVIFVDDVAGVPLEQVAPPLERHELFPQRANIHFVQVLSPGELRMRTWERGSGITQACGTGASAVCVAGVLTGRSGREALIHLPGGDLRLEWRQADGHVYMTGPAVEVFSGDW